MVRAARLAIKRQAFELRKAMDILQHEIVNIGVTLVVPKTVRLRLRGDEPEEFPLQSQTIGNEETRVTANMVNCKEWVYLDRLL